jgi:TrmH family RNA methyltransferase
LPEQRQFDRLDVVLVAPRNPLNIGAAARAMANFGFSQLCVVAPYAEHWREARSAVGAPELLQGAKESATLADAVAKFTLVIGTGSLTHRIPEQESISLPVLAPRVRSELERGGRVALVFGSEKRGLSREDLSRCQLFVEIPTSPQQPSMNLGQAVAVCLYELTRSECDEAATRAQDEPGRTNADSATLDTLAGLIEQTMTQANYSPRTMQAANVHDLRLLLRRLRLNASDARRILGFFRRVLWRLKHPREQRD